MPSHTAQTTLYSPNSPARKECSIFHPGPTVGHQHRDVWSIRGPWGLAARACDGIVVAAEAEVSGESASDSAVVGQFSAILTAYAPFDVVEEVSAVGDGNR